MSLHLFLSCYETWYPPPRTHYKCALGIRLGITLGTCFQRTFGFRDKTKDCSVQSMNNIYSLSMAPSEHYLPGQGYTVHYSVDMIYTRRESRKTAQWEVHIVQNSTQSKSICFCTSVTLGGKRVSICNLNRLSFQEVSARLSFTFWNIEVFWSYYERIMLNHVTQILTKNDHKDS